MLAKFQEIESIIDWRADFGTTLDGERVRDL